MILTRRFDDWWWSWSTFKEEDGAWWWWFTSWGMFPKAKKKGPKKTTLWDCQTKEGAEELVRRLASSSSFVGGDELAHRLYRRFLAFPPDEAKMQTLATLYETTRGRGDAQECACTLLYGVASDCINTTTCLPHRPLSSRSLVRSTTRKTKTRRRVRSL